MSSANQNRRTAVPIILLTLVLPLTLLIAPSLCEENKKKPATPSKAQREAIAALKNLGAVFEGGYAGGLAVRLDPRHITAPGRISKDVLAKLKTLTNLKALYVNNAFGRYKMSEAGLLDLKELSNLRALGLLSTQITDAELAHVAALSDLEMLVLVEHEITDGGG